MSVEMCTAYALQMSSKFNIRLCARCNKVVCVVISCVFATAYNFVTGMYSEIYCVDHMVQQIIDKNSNQSRSSVIK